MFMKVSSTKQMFSPSYAKVCLAKNNWKGQRNLDYKHIAYLEKQMKAGKFRGADISIAREKYNGGRELLVNGQHQLTAIINCNQTIDGQIDCYDCYQPSDFLELFSTFDMHRSRSTRQVINASRETLPVELQDFNILLLTTVGKALWKMDYPQSFNKQLRDKAEICRLYEKNTEICLWVKSHYSAATTSKMSVAVVSAMITSYRKDKVAAESFWRQVLLGCNLILDTAQYKLHSQLSEKRGFEIGKGVNTGDRLRFIYNLCGSYWNDWRKGGQVRSCIRSLSKIIGLIEFV
jgi:hypothetical protein